MAERQIILKVIEMATQSLNPDTFSDLAVILKQLAKTRHIGNIKEPK